jgi:hypothetical protein
MKKTIINFDAITGEETIIEREETAQEKKEREAVIKQVEEKAAQLNAEAEAKETARQAIADRLGLAADELKLLLG